MALPSPQPEHIAIIMDGNGRWAKKRHLPRTAGHKKAVSRVREIIEHCSKRHIHALTLFAFSSENWSRPEDEVSTLMSLLLHALKNETKKLHHNNIQLKIIGDRAPFNQPLQKHIQHAETLTADNTGLKLRLAINYGGKWDIINAMKQLINTADQPLSPDNITEKDLAPFLANADLPAPDLFIRTSNEQRLSNFMLWQLAYTELFFSDVFFPDFSSEVLDTAIDGYQNRERRFGQTSEQLKHKDKHVDT